MLAYATVFKGSTSCHYGFLNSIERISKQICNSGKMHLISQMFVQCFEEPRQQNGLCMYVRIVLISNSFGPILYYICYRQFMDFAV